MVAPTNRTRTKLLASSRDPANYKGSIWYVSLSIVCIHCDFYCIVLLSLTNLLHCTLNVCKSSLNCCWSWDCWLMKYWLVVVCLNERLVQPCGWCYVAKIKWVEVYVLCVWNSISHVCVASESTTRWERDHHSRSLWSTLVNGSCEVYFNWACEWCESVSALCVFALKS